MSKGAIAGIVVAIVVIFGLSLVGMYNGMVADRNQATKTWADVEAAYQRRLDVIPKFVETAKFSVKFQQDLAIEYAKAREGVATAAQAKNPTNLQEAANQSLAGLVIKVRQEAAVEAKTDQITELNAQIETIERTINHERVAYNEAARVFNTRIQTIPGVWFASMWNFKALESFKSEPGAEKSPDLNLDK